MNMDKRLRKTIQGKTINWGEFSTVYSEQAILSIDSQHISEIAERVHAYWIDAVQHLWFLLAEGYEVQGGYTIEKRQSHIQMCVPYDKLSMENKLKDCYVIKTLITPEKWQELGGMPYDYLFNKYNIGW